MRIASGIGTILLALIFLVIATPLYVVSSVVKRIWN